MPFSLNRAEKGKRVNGYSLLGKDPQITLINSRKKAQKAQKKKKWVSREDAEAQREKLMVIRYLLLGGRGRTGNRK